MSWILSQMPGRKTGTGLLPSSFFMPLACPFGRVQVWIGLDVHGLMIKIILSLSQKNAGLGFLESEMWGVNK